MNLTCRTCGYTDDFLEFPYICKNGCPACGESDLRRCPRCGEECVFSRAESLEDEEALMKRLSDRLAAVPVGGDARLKQEARDLIVQLADMNLRWNIKGLRDFLRQRQKELLF